MSLQESGKVREVVQYIIKPGHLGQWLIRWDIGDGTDGNKFGVLCDGPRTDQELKQLRASAYEDLEEQLAEAGLKIENLVDLPAPPGTMPPNWSQVFSGRL